MTVIRRPGASSAAVLLGLGTSLVAAYLIAPEWSRSAGLDVWNLPSANAQLRTAAEQEQEVLAFGERCARRREAATQIAARLASGAITLAVATDEIMEVFHEAPEVALVLETSYRTVPTERQRFALHAIDRVKRHLANEPDRCAVVVANLEKEYRALYASAEAPVAPVRADRGR
jgi:hypothetical protein